MSRTNQDLNRRSGSIRIAALLYAGSILLSRLIGLVREAVIGRVLGDGPQADVYFASFVLPDFLNYLLAGGALSLVFIPIFQAHLAREDAGEAWRAFSAIANVVLGLSVVATVALWFAAPALASVVAPGLGAEQHALLVRLTRIILPAQIFHLVGGVLSATLQARDKHAAPAMAPLIYALCVVGGGLALGPSMGAEGFSWGVLVGSLLGPFGAPLVASLRHGLRWSPILKHGDLRTWLWRSVPVMLGFSILVFDDLLTKRYGSTLGAGTIARLQYARTLMKVPMGALGMALGMAAYPTLSALWAQGKPAELWETLVRALRMLLLLIVCAQAALTVSGAEIAEVIWGTTRFDAASLQAIGRYTGLLCVGLWAWAAQLLVARGFYAQGDTWTPTIVGSVVTLLALPLYPFAAARWGAEGLALCSSVGVSIYVVVLALRLRVKLAAAEGPGLLSMVPVLLVGLALALAAGWALDGALEAWPALLRGGVKGVVAIAVCAGVALAAGLPEARAVVARLRR